MYIACSSHPKQCPHVVFCVFLILWTGTHLHPMSGIVKISNTSTVNTHTALGGRHESIVLLLNNKAASMHGHKPPLWSAYLIPSSKLVESERETSTQHQE